MDNKKQPDIKEAIDKILKDTDVATLITQLTTSFDQGIAEVYKGLNTLGQGLDLSRLQNFMVVNILIDKGIVTKEEIEERYKKEVADKLVEMQQKMKEELEKELDKVDQTATESK